MNAPTLVSGTREPVPVRDSMWVITDSVRKLFASPSLPDLDSWVDHALALIMTGGKAAREVPGWRTPHCRNCRADRSAKRRDRRAGYAGSWPPG